MPPKGSTKKATAATKGNDQTKINSSNKDSSKNANQKQQHNKQSGNNNLPPHGSQHHQHQHQQQQLIRYNVSELTEAPWLFQPLANLTSNNNNITSAQQQQQQDHFLSSALVKRLASEVDPTLVLSEDACEDVLKFVDGFLQDVVLGSARNARRRSRMDRDRLNGEILHDGADDDIQVNEDGADSHHNNNSLHQSGNKDPRIVDNIKRKTNGASSANKSYLLQQSKRTDYYGHDELLDEDDKLVPVILSAEDLEQEAASLLPKVFGGGRR